MGAELGALSHGSVPLPLLLGQPAGRRAPEPQTPAGLRFTAHQVGHGTTKHLLCLVFPRAGTTNNYTDFHEFISFRRSFVREEKGNQ